MRKGLKFCLSESLVNSLDVPPILSVISPTFRHYRFGNDIASAHDISETLFGRSTVENRNYGVVSGYLAINHGSLEERQL
jgi:hypothetical protein